MSCDLNDLWQKALSEIEKQISKPSFETWIKPTKPVSFDNLTMVIEVPNEFAKEWLENRYYDLIKDSVEEVTNKEVNLAFVSPNSGKQSSKSGMSGAEDIFPTSLNPRYTFDKFIVGNNLTLKHGSQF